MRSILPPALPLARGHSGFSLVEVTMALGIMAFCMVSILGLIPVGLNSVQSGREEARAAAALNLAATSVRSAQFKSRSSTGVATYQFPQFFSDNLNPASSPTTFTVGTQPWTYTFFVMEDGSLRRSNDVSPARLTMHVQVFPPATDAEPLRVYAAVAWPWKGSDKPTSLATDLKGRQGLVESLIVYAPRN